MPDIYDRSKAMAARMLSPRSKGGKGAGIMGKLMGGLGAKMGLPGGGMGGMPGMGGMGGLPRGMSLPSGLSGLMKKK